MAWFPYGRAADEFRTTAAGFAARVQRCKALVHLAFAVLLSIAIAMTAVFMVSVLVRVLGLCQSFWHQRALDQYVMCGRLPATLRRGS